MSRKPSRAFPVVFACIFASILISDYSYAKAKQAAAKPKPSNSLSKADIAAVKAATVNVLIAMKTGDVKKMQKLLYSNNGDYRILQYKGKEILEVNADDLGLMKRNENDIKNSVQYLSSVKRSILESVVIFGTAAKKSEPDATKLDIAAVKYKTPLGKEVLIILVKENGQWKLDNFPVFTPSLLNYNSVQDAIDADDDSVLYKP